AAVGILDVEVIARAVTAFPPLAGDALGADIVRETMHIVIPRERNRTPVPVFRRCDDHANQFRALEQMQWPDATRIFSPGQVLRTGWNPVPRVGFLRNVGFDQLRLCDDSIAQSDTQPLDQMRQLGVGDEFFVFEELDLFITDALRTRDAEADAEKSDVRLQ